MKTISSKPGEHLVSLDDDEMSALNNALNEVCNGVDIADFEFQTRLGYSRKRLRRLLDEINQIARGLPL